MYAIGDKIVYPMHGAGIVEKIEEKEILGELRKYYVLKVPCGDMKIMIPVDTSDAIGVRNIISAEEIEGTGKTWKSLKPEIWWKWLRSSEI